METIGYAKVMEKLEAAFPGAVYNAEEPYGLLTVNISPEKFIAILQFLRDDDELAFIFLTTLCGVHFPNRKEKFEMVYHLHSFINNLRLRIKVALAGDPPKIPTLTTLFSAANWLERETYDYFGIIFEGHPNLKRILNVDEMTIFPMRKEYPLEDNTRKDKNDEMFGRDPDLIQAERIHN
jgi:NADH-quinone oxidoreductase subunit C